MNGCGRNASRAGIRALSLSLSTRRDETDPQMASSRFIQLIDYLHEACIPSSTYDAFGRPLGRQGPSTLVQLSVHLGPASLSSMTILACLSDASREALFSHLQT